MWELIKELPQHNLIELRASMAIVVLLVIAWGEFTATKLRW